MNALTRLKAEIMADRKKAGVLAGLGVVALVLGARALIVSGAPAKPAQARVTPVADAPSGEANVAAQLSADADLRFRELVARSRETSRSTQVDRDLFALSDADFPRASETDAGNPEGAKFADQSDDETGAPASRGVESLVLKSTIVGRTPVAIVSLPGLAGSRDVMVRIGDAIGGLSVVRIEAGRVIVERDGRQFELTVKSPME